MQNSTIDYYNKRASEFVGRTQLISGFNETQDEFLELIVPRGLILDLGCGSGRDTKYFLERSFRVEAMDGAEELCKIATEYAGVPVKCVRFEDLDEAEKYDGVWACASLLHVPYEELSAVIGKVMKSLKPGGVFYLSFKKGEFEGMRHERHFTDMTESRARKLLENETQAEVMKIWDTNDARPGREQELWLNVFVRKLGSVGTE